jgi:hypothetical protein
LPSFSEMIAAASGIISAVGGMIPVAAGLDR